MSAEILHGRRKGQVKELPPVRTVHSANAQAPAVGDFRQVTILSKNDWDRIQFQLNKRHIEQERARNAQLEKERLHALSKEKVKNWGNTIAGQRQRKLEARQIREAKEEEEKKKIDIEEAKFQAQKRKEAIDRAKTQQYYQTDRVKGFHSALQLTEVLKEREAQIELKRLQEAAAGGKDQEWVERARREYEEGILRDQEEAHKRIQAAREHALFQKAQIREHLKASDIVKDDEVKEGEELKRLAAQYEVEKSRLDEIRKAESKQMLSDNLKQISDVAKMREIQKMQEEEENEECRIFAAAKRKMMRMRAEKEQQLHKEKQEKLEKIREKLHAQMQQMKDDEDDRIARAVQETEEKRSKEEAAKEAWSRKMHDEIAQHRTQQMLEKERQVSEARKKELEMLVVKREADAVFQRNEEEKRHRRLDDMRNLQNFRQSQVDERNKVAEMDRERQLAIDAKNQELIEAEEKQFQEYARRVIDHCDKGGRNTIPLRNAAKEGAGGGLGPQFPGKGGIRPSYMVNDQSGVQLPNYQRVTTNEVKKDIYGDGATAKRLGFVW